MVLPIGHRSVKVSKHALCRITNRESVNNKYVTGGFHKMPPSEKIKMLVNKFTNHYEFVWVKKGKRGHLFTKGNYELVLLFNDEEITVITVIVHGSKNRMVARMYGMQQEGAKYS